jgi:hypothetical protein
VGPAPAHLGLSYSHHNQRTTNATVDAPSNDYFASLLRGLQTQITALATQQNQYVIDHNQIRRISVGWQQEDNTYSIIIFDTSGNRRAVLGELPSGDHGIELLDPSGNTQELLPARDDSAGPTLSTTSATPVGLSGSPFVNINLGASRDCEITAGAFVGCAANDTANAYLVIDGGTPESIFGLGSTAASAGNVQSTRRISTWLNTTLTPNVGHSFTMAYASTSGTANFFANYLKVQPL